MVKYFDINDSGHSIKCKLFCHNERGMEEVVLFGHGFGGHKDNKAAERFANRVLAKQKTTGVLVLDWPCHGDDVKKKLTLADCDTYITLALKMIRERFGVERVSVYATSFGGYLFLKYLQERGNPFHKIALRCPAVNMYESLTTRIVSPDEMAKLAKGKEVLVGFDRKIKINSQFLAELQETDIRKMDFLDFAEDILILHGTKDEVIPFDIVREFADNSLIEFVPIENADHRFSDLKTMDAAIIRIQDFLELGKF